MLTYISGLFLILLSMIQVTWADFLLVWGFTFPLVPIFLWILRPRIKDTTLTLFAFGAGLIMDLLAARWMGTFAFSNLIAFGSVILLEEKTFHNQKLRRLLSLLGTTIIFTTVSVLMGKL